MRIDKRHIRTGEYENENACRNCDLLGSIEWSWYETYEPSRGPDFASRKEAEAYARKIGFPEVIKQVASLNEDGVADGEEIFEETTYRVKGVCKSKPTLPAHVRCLICDQKADLQNGAAAYDWQWLHEFEHQGHCVEAWETDPASPARSSNCGSRYELAALAFESRSKCQIPNRPASRL